MTERWAPIPGWEESYEVSDRGRIRSLPRWRAGRATGDGKPSVRPIPGKLLTTRERGRHMVANLWRDGKPHQISVTTAMRAAFGELDGTS